MILARMAWLPICIGLLVMREDLIRKNCTIAFRPCVLPLSGLPRAAIDSGGIQRNTSAATSWVHIAPALLHHLVGGLHRNDAATSRAHVAPTLLYHLAGRIHHTDASSS